MKGTGRRFRRIGRDIGAIVTDTEHAGRHNRVVGGDLSIKFTAPQQLSATFLSSQTGIATSGDAHGTASQLSYSYNTRRFGWANQVEHYGRDFQMDTAFYNHTGFTSGWSFGEVNFYPKNGSNFWLRRVHPYYFARRGRDEVQNGNEDFLNTGVRFHFTRQGYLDVTHGQGHEPRHEQRAEVARLREPDRPDAAGRHGEELLLPIQIGRQEDDDQDLADLGRLERQPPEMDPQTRAVDRLADPRRDGKQEAADPDETDRVRVALERAMVPHEDERQPLRLTV